MQSKKVKNYQARIKTFLETRVQGAQNPLSAQRLSQLQFYRQRLRDVQGQRNQSSDGMVAGVTSGGKSGVINWSPIGPSVVSGSGLLGWPSMSGRVTSLAITPDGQTLYAGAANGGVWKSTDGGASWLPIMNALNLQPAAQQSDSLAVGGLAIDTKNSNRIYVGSGEAGNFLDEVDFDNITGKGYFGAGALISEDGGNTWTQETLNDDGTTIFNWNGSAFYKLSVDPNTPTRVYGASTQGFLIRTSRNQGYTENLFPPKEFQPQSYLLFYKSSSGAVANKYFDKSGVDLKDGLSLGANGGWKNFTELVPFAFQGIPYFFMYLPTSDENNVKVFSLGGTGSPSLLQTDTWDKNLLFANFNLNGRTVLLRYTNGESTANLSQWNSDGSLTVVQQELDLGASGLQLVPLQVAGSAYLLAYKIEDGSTTTYQWEPDGTLTQITTLAIGTLPAKANLLPFIRDTQQLFITYVADSGSFRTWRVQPDLIPVSDFNPGEDWDKSLKMVNSSINDKPYLLTYDGDGTGKLYDFAVSEPVLKWTKPNLTDDWIPMPYLMGFEWVIDQNMRVTTCTDVVATDVNEATTVYLAFLGEGVYYFDTESGTGVTDSQSFDGRISLAILNGEDGEILALDQSGKLQYLERLFGTWKTVEDMPDEETFLNGQGGFDLLIDVSPGDPSVIYLGGAGQTDETVSMQVGSFYRAVFDSSTPKVTPTLIGKTIHPDMHAIVFDDTNPVTAYVGCDGGVFKADNINGVNVSTIFASKNAGLANITFERMGQHPLYDAVIFAGTQDNGAQRFFGDEVWDFLDGGGDAGACIVNWNDPTKVIIGQTSFNIVLSTKSGAVGSFKTDVSVPGGRLADEVAFYPPLITTPSTADTFENVLAFGSNYPWVSTDFGANWKTIPDNDDTDNLESVIRSMVFSADGKTLYVGTIKGKVFQFDQTNSWARTEITGENLPANVPITGIAVDTANQGSVWVTLGGSFDNGWQRVWYYQPNEETKWVARSGSQANAADALLDIQYNAIIVGSSSQTLYAGADLGVWASSDGGTSWSPMGDGLPEAAVLDLRFFPANSGGMTNPNLLRALTYGRGIYEIVLDDTESFKKLVQLYIKSSVLDRGMYPMVDDVALPDGSGLVTDHRDSPDIKLIQDISGDNSEKFEFDSTISFETFTLSVKDIAQTLKTQIVSRAYVQVHNRGIADAENTSVRLIISKKIGDALGDKPTPQDADPDPKPPDFPFEALSTNAPIGNSEDWFDLETLNITNLNAGLPKVISVDIPVERLKDAGVYCLVAICFQAKDSFTSDSTSTDDVTVKDPKVVMKYLKASV